MPTKSNPAAARATQSQSAELLDGQPSTPVDVKALLEQYGCGPIPLTGTANALYEDKDVVTGKLIRIGMLKPTRTIATAAGYKLCEFEISKPTKRGQSHHHVRNLAAATQPKRRHRPPRAPTTKATTPAATAPSRRAPRPPASLPAK